MRSGALRSVRYRTLDVGIPGPRPRRCHPASSLSAKAPRLPCAESLPDRCRIPSSRPRLPPPQAAARKALALPNCRRSTSWRTQPIPPLRPNVKLSCTVLASALLCRNFPSPASFRLRSPFSLAGRRRSQKHRRLVLSGVPPQLLLPARTTASSPLAEAPHIGLRNGAGESFGLGASTDPSRLSEAALRGLSLKFAPWS